MYVPQGPPAVYFSVLASSVIVIAAVPGLLPPCVVSSLGLCLHLPELRSDTLLFRRGLLGPRLSVDLPLPCGQITVVLFHKNRGLVIQPLERLYVGIAILFQDTGQPVHPAVNLVLYACDEYYPEGREAVEFAASIWDCDLDPEDYQFQEMEDIT